MTPFSAIFEAEQSRYRYHLSVSLFGEFGFSVRETRTVGEREKVVFKVFLLE